MKYHIHIKPGSKEGGVEETWEGDQRMFVVRVKARPEKGKANEALIKVLADYFNTPPSLVKIVSGHTSRHKIVEIE